MSNRGKSEAESIIIDFLNDHPSPTTQDWKQLVERYPEHASAIADAAIIRTAGDVADALDEPCDVDEALASRTVSRVLNKIHQMANSSIEQAKSKVESARKPAERRKIAEAVGIGPYPELLNGVLSGRTRAPSRILTALSSIFDVPKLVLIELFRRCFESSPVPAFKGGGSKPKVAIEPGSWEEAVRGLKLSEEETTRLLKLGEDD